MLKTEDYDMVACLNHGITSHIHTLAVADDTTNVSTIGQSQILYRFLGYKALAIDGELGNHSLDKGKALDA